MIRLFPKLLKRHKNVPVCDWRTLDFSELEHLVCVFVRTARWVERTSVRWRGRQAWPSSTCEGFVERVWWGCQWPWMRGKYCYIKDRSKFTWHLGRVLGKFLRKVLVFSSKSSICKLFFFEQCLLPARAHYKIDPYEIGRDNAVYLTVYWIYIPSENQ